jgi:hypothetical protein
MQFKAMDRFVSDLINSYDNLLLHFELTILFICSISFVLDSLLSSKYDIQKVREGDVVTMCSATFGNEMWSTRGVGLTRVLAAIRVRSGSTVKLALESPGEGKRKAAMTAKQVQAANEARMAAQAKKDRLLAELERDEVKLKKKFFGLF